MTDRSELIGTFLARFAAARHMIPPGSTSSERERGFIRALSVAGVTRAVAEDGVVRLPEDWWWSPEARVFLPPVEYLPPLQRPMRVMPHRCVLKERPAQAMAS